MLGRVSPAFYNGLAFIIIFEFVEIFNNLETHAIQRQTKSTHTERNRENELSNLLLLMHSYL